MLFNTLDFAIFLPVMFVLYWFILDKNLKTQNLLIVVGSYVFYGWWDWRFLILIFFSSTVDFIIGRALSTPRNKRQRKSLLWVSILVNVGVLGFFKYSNFFIENFIEGFSFLGGEFQLSSLKVILPVGISFYTFQSLSYSIDVYRGKIKPTNDIISFLAYVSFFPQLVAGPIERANRLLPQFTKKRSFEYSNAIDGLRQMLWGFFKKLVIADNCAELANVAFMNSSDHSGSTLALGVMFFAFQIYGDFSGYSDIAIGTSKLFGVQLMQNFAFPYFSRDIAEFWRRWHISLSTWFRDYLYIPMGGSRCSKTKQIRNILTVFIISGFWHGANWTYISWGVINALLFLPLMLYGSNRANLNTVASGRFLPSSKEFVQVVVTFVMTSIAWVFFRAESLEHAFSYLKQLFSASLFTLPDFNSDKNVIVTLLLLFFFLLIEWLGREQKYAIEFLGRKWNRYARWCMYSLIIFIIGMFAHTEKMPFIYFRF